MFLTKENYELIVKYLLEHGIKDIDFPSIINTEVNKDDLLTIVHQYGNRKITIEEFQKALLKVVVYKSGDVPIEDTLISNRVDTALSANLGKLLNEKIEEYKKKSTIIVSNKSDLTNPNTWKDSDDSYYHYKGMSVTVIEENTIYVYSGETGNITDVQNPKKWVLCSGSVLKVDDLEELTSKDPKPGDIVYITGTDTLFYLDKDNNRKTLIGTGIPILNLSELDKLNGITPEHYISVPDYEELISSLVTNKSYTVTNNGSYMDVLFSAIRQLLTEVTKLKNTFAMGINSYNEEDTAIASEVTEDFEEPLWAMDEDNLAALEAINIGEGNDITPISNVNDSIAGRLIINNEGSYACNNTESELSQKHYMYITSSSKDIKITFKKLSNNDTLQINFNDFQTTYNTPYNIALVVSRTRTTGGKNFIYIIISNKDSVLLEGYYNTSTGKLQDTEVLLSDNYFIKNITFKNLELYKCNIYYKDFDFSHGIVPSAPSDDDEKYKAAHITIRSISTLTKALTIVRQLLNNELIYIEDLKGLYIVSNGTLQSLATTNGKNNTGMEWTEIVTKLESMGIITNTNGNLEINDLNGITFIHQESGKKYKFSINENGELNNQEISKDTLSKDISTYSVSTSGELDNIRGLISRILIAKNTTSTNPIVATDDVKLYSDRLKIGAFYAPLSTDKAFGCSHAYIELENTSLTDINLEGITLYYSTIISDNPKVLALPLTGIIKGSSTYLIRGKQYANYDDANCFIKVDSYDLEWYYNAGTTTKPNYQLVDLSTPITEGRALMLTYNSTSETINYNTTTWAANTDSATKKSFPYKLKGYFIDAMLYVGASGVISNNIGTSTGDAGAKQITYFWAPGGGDDYAGSPAVLKSNSIVKNTFMLDPAKQAFQSLSKIDSSRARWASKSDVLILSLANEYIEFPKTNAKYPVSKFAPKASKLNKNVCTDKTQMDKIRPNMVTCSFGINMLTTRTFNWISNGLFDEYVWIVKGDYRGKTYDELYEYAQNNPTVLLELAKMARFESYKESSESDIMGTSGMIKKTISNSTYKKAIYNRITSIFPGCNDTFTAHKCIVNIVSEAVSTKTTYSYIVGRADKNGNPDINHCSKIQTFTLYPATAEPVIIQTSDQLGFHWIEYQVWAAAADKLNSEIKKISDADKMPILVNTGDMTLNGTRINEWLDYYNAGANLFDHLEQINCVGNNDLCGTMPTELGTGDDDGKSNAYYFHLFYCYEIDENNAPVYVGTDGTTRYIPSLYYMTVPVNDKKDNDDYTLVVCNSEITEVTCEKWYKATVSSGSIINIYTGYTLGANAEACNYQSSTNRYIYEQLYKIFNTYKNTKIVVACHEMPFTVITNASLKPTAGTYTRAWNGTDGSTGVVGSHMNQISFNDYKGTYWFSRLLESFGIKLCIGGHKHTYSCTYPIKENWSGSMSSTLQSDTFNIAGQLNSINITKKPLVKVASIPTDTDTVIYPGIAKADLTNGVVYFMCLATGYKLTSNKELPSENQVFSLLVPKTTINATTGKDEANANQKYPMFGIIEMKNNAVKLVRIANIMSNGKFDLYTHPTTTIKLQYATTGTDRFGAWTDTESYLISSL